ncbi:unnamed protein product, partial [Durusdinium trenchii]
VSHLGRAEIAELDWLKAEDFFAARPGLQIDVILAADVVWLMELVEPLVNAIQIAAQHNPNVEVLVVHQTRSASVESAFIQVELRKLSQFFHLLNVIT